MTSRSLTVRISTELERDLLEIVEQKRLDKATVVKILLEMGIAEWRKQTALECLREGKVTFAKAAEMSKLSLWEFADLVKRHNVEWVKYTPEEIDREIQESSAMKTK